MLELPQDQKGKVEVWHVCPTNEPHDVEHVHVDEEQALVIQCDCTPEVEDCRASGGGILIIHKHFAWN